MLLHVKKMRRLALVSIVASGLGVGCGKDDDDDKEEITAAQLLAELDVSCAGESCIAAPTALRLEEDESFVQTIRGFFWVVTGFPTSAAYDGFVGGANEHIPEEGLVGRLESIRQYVAEKTIANYDITSCADAPTSGTYTDPDDGSVMTYGEPKFSAPASFPKTGKYDKHVSYVNSASNVTAIFELFCDYSGMMIKYNTVVNDETVQYAFYYDRDDEDNGHYEFFIHDVSGSISSGPISLGLKVNVLADSFHMAMTRTGEDDEGMVGYRAIGHTALASQKTSLFYNDISGTGMTQAQWDASDLVTDTAISGGVAPNAGDATDKRQGCAATFETMTNDISSNALCDGLALKDPGAPGLNADGDWSMGWFEDNLATELTNLK